MGQIVEFPSNGGTAGGYLATPDNGSAGPGLIVIQEWWGIVPHIEDVCDRFAAEGSRAAGRPARAPSRRPCRSIKACVPFYGLIPWPDSQPDWSKLEAPVQGHYAGEDEFFTPEAARELEATLKDLGKEVEIIVYPGAQHAFFNDSRPEVYDDEAAHQAWTGTLSFLRGHLG